MGSSIKFELNRAGVRDLMRSTEMMEVCKGYADAALAKLGEGYETDQYTGKNRVNAEVRARTYQAKKDNYRNNSISKAVFG